MVCGGDDTDCVERLVTLQCVDGTWQWMEYLFAVVCDAGPSPDGDGGSSDGGVPPDTTDTADVEADATYCSAPPDYAPVNLDALMADPMSFHGQSVLLIAPVVIGPPDCDTVECPPADPCCAGCGASFLIQGDGNPIEISPGAIAEDVGCSGDSCTPVADCGPLEVNTEYLLWGKIQAPIEFVTGLLLDGFCPAGP